MVNVGQKSEEFDAKKHPKAWSRNQSEQWAVFLRKLCVGVLCKLRYGLQSQYSYRPEYTYGF